MTEDILESNKLIAKFMGETYRDNGFPYIIKIHNSSICKSNPKGEVGHPIHYHDEWNWLMPVVEKIAKLQFKPVEVINNGEDSYYDNIYPRTFAMTNADTRKFMVRLNKFPLHQSNSLIEATYYAVIEFIEWYNKQK